MKRVKSRKQLTESEALEKIGLIAMELQSEQEALVTTYYPNRDKTRDEMDTLTNFILTVSGEKDMNSLVTATQKRIEYLNWKTHEDYGRFVSPGTHQLAGGHIFYKREE